METTNEENINRYLIVKATHGEYVSLATWLSTTGLEELILKRWLFLSSGGYPLFGTDLGLESDIEGAIPPTVLSELRKRRRHAFDAVKSVKIEDHLEGRSPLIVDNPPTVVSRGSIRTSLGKIGVIYNELNKPSLDDVQLLAIANEWVVPYVEPSASRMGPSGSPLSHSYYESLKEYFDVNTHLVANATDTYFTTFATQWPLGPETIGSRGNILNVLSSFAKEGGPYELNLLFLGDYYQGFLSYILKTLMVYNSRTTVFVVHEDGGTRGDIVPVYTRIINGRVFSVYGTTDDNRPSIDQLRVLGLMLGAPRARQNISIPFVSDYERAVLVGSRAEQIARGSRPRVAVDPTEVDPYPIAAREFAQKRIGLNILRRFPNGEEEILNPDELHVESHASPVNVLI